MTHFIKLIPATGTIREGDWYAPAGDLRFLTRRCDPNGKYDYSKCQRYKLYLCNKEVKLYERFIWFHGRITTPMTEEELKILTIDCENNLGARLIGETNPKATWVCEGDQYTDEEITIVPLCAHYSEKHLWNDCSCRSGFIDGVVIKRKNKTK